MRDYNEIERYKYVSTSGKWVCTDQCSGGSYNYELRDTVYPPEEKFIRKLNRFGSYDYMPNPNYKGGKHLAAIKELQEKKLSENKLTVQSVREINMQTRRKFLKDIILGLGAAALNGCATWDQSINMNKEYLVPASDKVRKFHHDALVVDLHSDTLIWHDLFGYDLLKKHTNPFPSSPLLGHVDVPRLIEGGVDLQFFGIVTNYWVQQFKNAYDDALALGKIVKKSKDLVWATDYKSAQKAYASGKIGVVLGMEGAHPLEGKLENLDPFYEAGLRYIGLTHFNDTEAAYSASDIDNKNKPLTKFGKELIARMDELGIIVDLAHVNYKGFFEAIECTKNPVIVSHTGVSACLDEPERNIDDAQIRAVAESGGVIGIMYAPIFLNGCLSGKIHDVVRHMNHVRKVVGVDYIALGSDFDGFITLPDELRDVSDLPVLTQTLFDSGYSEKDVKKVLGENFMRVYKQVCR